MALPNSVNFAPTNAGSNHMAEVSVIAAAQGGGEVSRLM